RFQAVNKDEKLFYHRVGAPQAEDILVYYRADQPDWDYYGQVTEDGRYLVISVHKGTDPNDRVIYKDLAEPYGQTIDLISNFDNEYEFLGNDGSVFYFKTDLDAPKGRLIAIDVKSPDQKNWKGLVPESAEAIEGARMTGDLFCVSYLKDAVTQVRLYKTDG